MLLVPFGLHHLMRDSFCMFYGVELAEDECRACMRVGVLCVMGIMGFCLTLWGIMN